MILDFRFLTPFYGPAETLLKFLKIPILKPWNQNIKAAAYLNPADADASLKKLLDGAGEEECDGESHRGVQRHRHKHTAGWDGVSQKDVEGEGDEDDDLAGAEEGGHVEAAQVGALHDLGDLLAKTKQTITQL